jgi:hypothetical protein
MVIGRGKLNEVGHHKTHMKSPCIETDALLSQVGIYQPKLWYQFVFPKCKQNFKVFKYSYNKSQRAALFLRFIFDKELYTFRTDLLSIIRSLKTVYAAIGICQASYVDCLLARS